MTTIYKRNGKWTVDFRFRGKRIRRTSPVNTRKGAEAYLRLLQDELLAGKPASSPTLTEHWERYLRDHVSALARESRVAYVNRAAHWLPELGKLRISAIDAATIEAYAARRRSAGAAPDTIRLECTVLRSCLQAAVRWGLLATAPKPRLAIPAVRRQRYLDPDEVNALVEACGPNIRSMVIVAVHTGMRLGELLGLRWADVDRQAKRCTVSRQRARRAEEALPKNRQARTLPLSKAALAAILDVPRRIGSPYVWSFGKTAAQKALAKAARKAGLPGVGWHTLRHTCASWLAQAGLPLTMLQAILGHASPIQTMRYAHLCPTSLDSAAQLLDGHHVVTTERTAKKP